MKNISKIAKEILKNAARKPLIFKQYKAFKDSVIKLEKKKIKIKVDKDKLMIAFVNDADRREAFKILGKDYLKLYTTWKGPSIW